MVKPVNKPARICEEIANKTDTLAKTAKVLLSVLDVAAAIFTVISGTNAPSAGFNLLKTQLKDHKDVVSAVGFLGRAEWLNPKERSKILNSPLYKIVNKVTLTAGQILETVAFVDKLSYRYFVQPSLSFGALPILELVKNAFFAISISSTLYGAVKDSSRVSESLEKRKRKLWVLEKTKSVEKLQEKYKEKIGNASLEIKPKWKKYQEVLSGDNGLNNYLKHKIEAYKARVHNDTQNKQKAWMTIAASVTTLFMIFVGSSVMAFSLAAPVLTLPFVSLFMASSGLITNIVGLAKNLYIDVYIQPRNELRKGL